MPQDSAPSDPRVSVLLAVHNGVAFVEEAVRSMMQQTLREIEIIVVDDASTDETPTILAKLAAEDPRIRRVTLAENRRLPGALNAGLEVARAPLVARMDADDISYPQRLAVQLAFMQQNPEVVALGTSFRRISAQGQPLHITLAPWTTAQLRWRSRFRIPFQHPTVMFRRLPRGETMYYDPSFTISEDADFFGRMLERGELACLPDVLLDYREHGNNTTRTKWAEQIAQADRARRRLITAELPAPVVEALDPVLRAFAGEQGVPPRHIFAGLRAMLKHDLTRMPDDRAFLRRQTAQLALQALRRGGCSSRSALATFCTSGLDMIPALALRLGEVKRIVPMKKSEVSR